MGLHGCVLVFECARAAVLYFFLALQCLTFAGPPPLAELRALPPSPTVLGLLAAFDGPVPPTQLDLSAPCTVDELVALGRLVSAASSGFRRAVICGALGRGSATSAPIVAAFEQIVRGLPEGLGHLRFVRAAAPCFS